MKTKNDPRHQKRIKIIKALYSTKFAHTNPINLFENKEKFNRIIKELTEINLLIDKFTTRFTSDKMSKLDLSILQLGVYEIKYEKKVPYRVVIDECIEIAKEFGAINSAKFINAVLGKLVEQNNEK